jgi:small subunit ribosomal protein S16
MVTIRLTRRVGLFNPVARGAEVKLRLNVARIEHWVAQGAHMSDRVKFLLTSFRKQAA